MLVGCQSPSDKVEQLKDKVEVGSSVNLVDLFQCNDGVTVGVKNANSFNSNKVGSYSVELTITDGSKQEDKSYIVSVYDDKKPELKVKDATIYEGDSFDEMKSVSCKDNSAEVISPSAIENNLDTKKPGTYTIKYSATDSSGNTAEASRTVTVKKKYSFKEMKALVKKVVGQSKYKKIFKVTYDNTKELIWIELKDTFSHTYNKGWVRGYAIDPYWTISKDKKTYKLSLYTWVYYSDYKTYNAPKRMYLSSAGGKIEVDSFNVDYDWKGLYNTRYSSEMTFQCEKKGEVQSLGKILKGKSLKFTVYMKKKDIIHKCNSKQSSVMRGLANIQEEINNYL